MQSAFEERKRAYLENTGEEYRPSGKEWWDIPSPVYYSTSEYAGNFKQPAEPGDAVIFKPRKSEWPLYIAISFIAITLLYIIAEKVSGTMLFISLLLSLLFILPWLIDSPPRITLNKEGIGLHHEKVYILWRNVVACYISEQRGEKPVQTLILHYYDETTDSFTKSEVSLDRLPGPELIAATIEAFRQQA